MRAGRRDLPRLPGPRAPGRAAACRPPASSRPTRSWARSAGAGTTRPSWPRRWRSHHLLIGELGWIGFRLTTMATVFMIVLTLFGIPRSPLALLAIPAAVLTGLAFFGADHRLRRHPPQRLRLRGALPLRHQPALPVQRHLLPGLPACPMRRVVAAADAALPRRGAGARAVLDRSRAIWPLHLAYLVVFAGRRTWSSPIGSCGGGW